MAEIELPNSGPPGSLVRSFMVTGGRTTTAAAAPELPLETIVGRAPGSEAGANTLQFEARKVYEFLGTDTSIAEISAHFQLPLRAAVVLISEMVAQGTLAKAEVVDVVDIDFLLRIRSAIQAI